jgi:hypothetical protein
VWSQPRSTGVVGAGHRLHVSSAPRDAAHTLPRLPICLARCALEGQFESLQQTDANRTFRVNPSMGAAHKPRLPRNGIEVIGQQSFHGSMIHQETF